MTEKKYRIRRQDKRNLVLEIWQPGRLIEKGKYQGQMSDPKWEILGYYGTVDSLVVGLLKMTINPSFIAESRLLSKRGTDSLIAGVRSEVLRAIDAAKKEILDGLQNSGLQE